ncbi:hypothetical protein Glove_218g53 [Diversispora epigaea]|uniref:Uncharacterized protein n=1 Tax=Diversispora epigaea TaxID=1348612 RepID=A0A397IGU4_9GLOM|nr:hypothetical protein Glove_218g53 [Diversispora epigaea]
MNLNKNLRKGQYQPALRLMQNQAPIGNPPIQNPPENSTPAPEDDLISFNRNPPTLQPREAATPAADPEVGSSTKRNKTILIHKNIANGIEFYNGKRKWYGVKEDFHALYNKYHFIKVDNTETVIETYKRIIEESEAIAEKTNRQVDMRKSGSYTLISLKLFRETTLAPKRSEKIDEKENAWLNLASTGTLIFAEKYKGEDNQYDVNSMYIYEMLKKEASWPIAPATIEGNPPKKSFQCTRYLRYNLYGIYTHYDLKYAKENGLNVYLIDESLNALIYEKNTRINGKDMFGKWGNILYNIKKEGGTVGKVGKALLVSLWGTLCEQRNGQNYGKSNKAHSYGWIYSSRASKSQNRHRNRRAKIREKRIYQILKDKEQNTKLTVKRKAPKRYDINLPNEIIIEIFQHLRTQNDSLCELIKKKPIASVIKYIKQIEFERIDNYFNTNEFLLEDIISICQDIISISFKDCGWRFLNNSSLKMTLNTYKILNNIIIYGSNRIAPKTVLSIPERCTNQPIIDCFSTNETEDNQAIEDIFYED